MQFDSFTFPLFFALLLAAYNLLGGWNARKNLLLIASYVFYAAWNPPFLLLLLASTTLDWWIAQRIDAQAQPSRRRAWLVATLLINLGVLGYFKYSRFVLDNFCLLLASVGVHYAPPQWDIVLPIGISFYTFHSLSYCIDIYRSKFAPTRSWRDYALYVAFFPQLVAGPIVRWTQMREQIAEPRATTAAGLGLGLALLTLGLFEKIVLADSVFAPAADALFNQAAATDARSAWIGVAAFSGQIFCDFAGYSTCALGVALALGFALPINFRQPYAAIGFSDFWRRWHISLSSWLRDYLYVALGGNRDGRWRTYRNLLLTMLIGGLWHGAAWTFVIWGGLHGSYLLIERFARERGFAPERGSLLQRTAVMAVTLLAVMYAWLWFRAGSVEAAWRIHHSLFAVTTSAAALSPEQIVAAAVFAALVVTQLLLRERDAGTLFARLPVLVRSLLLAAMLTLIALSPGENHAFIYFQF